MSGNSRAHIAFDSFTRWRLRTLIPIVGGEHWLLIGATGHYQATSGIENHLVYVAMHDDGSQRTYTSADFAAKLGWKNDPSRATFAKLSPEAARIIAAPAEGYGQRLAAQGWQVLACGWYRGNGRHRSDGGTVLGKIAFQPTPSDSSLTDSDVGAIRNLPILEGTLRL